MKKKTGFYLSIGMLMGKQGFGRQRCNEGILGEHTAIFGPTGSGKSKLTELLGTQVMMNDRGLCLIDQAGVEKDMVAVHHKGIEPSVIDHEDVSLGGGGRGAARRGFGCAISSLSTW